MARNNLWAPWRLSYMRDIIGESASDPPPPPPPASPPGKCFFCQAEGAAWTDAERQRLLLLVRDERGTLRLNRYPYTNGHLLVAPHEHIADFADLSASQRSGLMELAAVGERLLRRVMNPQGMNIGMNLGRCAGAGMPGHVHMHIVPRWYGDVNFMDVVGEVRVIPQSLEASYEALRSALAHV